MVISDRDVLYAVGLALGKIKEVFERRMDREGQQPSLPRMGIPPVKKEPSGEGGQRRDIAFCFVGQKKAKKGSHGDSRDEYLFTGNPKFLIPRFHGLIPVLPFFCFQIFDRRSMT